MDKGLLAEVNLIVTAENFRFAKEELEKQLSYERIEQMGERRCKMIHYTCNDCQCGFVATSYNEAKEEAKLLVTVDEEMVEDEELVYAKFCPYCGSIAIVAR